MPTRRRVRIMSKKICLDAGHVGSKYNQSPVVKTYYESAMVWALHLKLKAQLEARGFQVVTTRASIDTDLGVYERGTASKGCDIFISLHSNACGTESVDYPVVYRAYDNKNNVDTLALKLAKKVGELMGTTQAGRTATRKNSSGGEYYGVLRGARAVGTPYYMLIEHSFHTNTKATKWLSKDANLDKLAVAEADILAEFFGMESSTETEKTAIMGKAQATAQQMALFCRSKNSTPQLTSCSLEQLAEMFIEEGEAEGVRGDVAFAQSLHETGYFKFGGIVLPTQNNYAGIGALNGNATGQAASFPDPRTGVRAQIQHLKAYASTEALVNECVDPRFSLVARGVAPYVEWLGAADNPQGCGWAVPGAGYGANIVKLLGQIMAQETPQAPAEPENDGYPEGTPDWQKEGFEILVQRGIINSPDVWKARFDQPIMVGEILAIIGRM
jgi:N-acetylmuramoyl-L-alanine amidase